MFNIMRADIYRILRGKGIYICLLIITVMVSINIYLGDAAAMGISVDVAVLEEVESLDEFIKNVESNAESEEMDGCYAYASF